MKKRIIALLIGVLCLSAINGFAQTQKETPQEKIIRLEVENRVLEERVKGLTQEIVSLQSQLAAARAQQSPATGMNQSGIGLKSYYANAEIQQKCEQYPLCAKWVADTYNRFVLKNRYLKITKIEEKTETYNRYSFSAPSIEYSLYLHTNFDPENPCIFYRSGKGKKDSENEEIVEVEHEGIVQTQFFLQN